jgi:hypothetical protein
MADPVLAGCRICRTTAITFTQRRWLNCVCYVPKSISAVDARRFTTRDKWQSPSTFCSLSGDAAVVEAPVEDESPQQLTKDIIDFKLRDTRVPLPLGWMLSAAAAGTIRKQIKLDDDVVQSQSAMNEVLKALPPPR